MHLLAAVTVEGRNFKCEASSGCEYLSDEGDGIGICGTGYGFPFRPYRFQRVIDDEHAYLVDNEGILWILEHIEYQRLYGTNLNLGHCFHRPCLRTCLNYVMHYDPDMKGKMPSEVLDEIGVSDPRAHLYDASYRRSGWA